MHSVHEYTEILTTAWSRCLELTWYTAVTFITNGRFIESSLTRGEKLTVLDQCFQRKMYRLAFHQQQEGMPTFPACFLFEKTYLL